MLLGGAFALPLLAGVVRRLPTTQRTLETIGLFLLFVIACLMLDRFRLFDRPPLQAVPNEVREARGLGQLRIGVPEGLVHLEALRKQGRLERRLAALGVSVMWRDYVSASTLLQALNQGDIDFGGGGGTPSIFAQAADLLFVRVARDKYTNAGGEAILVADDSPIRSISDLRGSRVVVEEGSTAHYVLVRALLNAGLELTEVEIVFDSRSEALSQFLAGSVQAWSVWVPYADSPRRTDYPGRSIASLQDLFESNLTLQLPTLYYSSVELLRNFPTILKALLEEINEAGAQVNRENLAAVERLRDQLQVSDAWLDRLRTLANERSIVPLDSLSLNGLQRQADTLRDLRLIPRRVRVGDGTYSSIMLQNWTV